MTFYANLQMNILNTNLMTKYSVNLVFLSKTYKLDIGHGLSACTVDNPRVLASGLSTVPAEEPCSISLVAWYPV